LTELGITIFYSPENFNMTDFFQTDIEIPGGSEKKLDRPCVIEIVMSGGLEKIRGDRI